jgi:hypothetical protein
MVTFPLAFTFSCFLPPFIYISLLPSLFLFIELELFHFFSDDKKSSLQCFLQKGKMIFQSSTQPKQLFTDFSSYRFEPQKWYHVAFVHIRHRFGADEMRLLVNGILKFTAKSAIVPSGSGSNMGIYFGTPSTSGRAQHSDQRWRLGPTYLIEDLLTPNVIHSIFAMGPSYHFNFQSGQFSRHQTYEVICHENLTLIKEQDHTSPLGPLDLTTASITIPEDKILLSLNARTALTLEELENMSDDTEGLSLSLLFVGVVPCLIPFTHYSLVNLLYTFIRPRDCDGKLRRYGWELESHFDGRMSTT